MKITSSYVNGLNYVNKKSVEKHSDLSQQTVSTQYLPSFCARKPLTEAEKANVFELKSLTPLMRDEHGKFSVDKAAELLKSKIDEQLMSYLEKDIKQIVSNVLEKNPGKTREDVLNVMEKLSSFSNYDSFSKIEDYCKKNNIVRFASTKTLTINDVFKYLSNSRKDLLHLPMASMTTKKKGAIVADRNLVNYLKNIKNQNPQKIEDLKWMIKSNTVKLVLLDGFEAKTKNGCKSFNFVGNWDNLEETTDLILKDGKDAFNEDIENDLKDIFGNDIPFDVIENKSETLDEKEIAKRLNSRTITKDDIKIALTGIALYSVPQAIKNGTKVDNFKEKSFTDDVKITLRNTRNVLEQKDITRDEIIDKYIEFDLYKNEIDEKKKNSVIEATAKIMYLTMDLYSPQRIAKELKNLNKKIEEKLQEIGKTTDDVCYIVPDVAKSFSLVSYQNAKVNNISQNQFICERENIYDYAKKKDHNPKVYVFIDDFAGSGQSMLEDSLFYEDFKFLIENEPFIFAPMTHTKFVKNRINKVIMTLMNDLQKKTNDCFIGGKEVKDANDYIKVLASDKKALLKYAFDDGFHESYSTVGFPHVIPDNCSDVAGYMFEKTVRSKRANKAEMRVVKRKTIDYILSLRRAENIQR